MPANIEFDEDKFITGSRPQQSGSLSGLSGQPGMQIRYPQAGHQSAMVRFLIRHHLAKDQETAQMYLIALVIINFIATFIVLKFIL